MKPELKRYYLMQMAYWFQQLIVLVLGLEKPRKDFNELVAHHLVTLWLVGYVSPSFSLYRVSDQSIVPQLELHDKSHVDRQCSIHEHGYPRHGLGSQYSATAHDHGIHPLQPVFETAELHPMESSQGRVLCDLRLCLDVSFCRRAFLDET
jgi:hypothetical protein